ncbi:glycosyltransferase [Paenibacillus protaetiae]|uniref:Glycosyltransferase n=1 Tax=Paenibacillus protaetiae TaxID=2509456 RepID=A0A4P6EX12_9BACL|nr:glycosyltransferase [Paenibacillus protaetiae]QAY66763.1 glycosyltransferase [Paenibacillus protaetiae]
MGSVDLNINKYKNKDGKRGLSMKNIYICFLREESDIIGILNKIKQQCIAIDNIGIKSFLVISRNDSVVLYEVINEVLVEIISQKYTKFALYNENHKRIFKKISSFIRLKEFLNFAQKQIIYRSADSVYIRNIQPITLDVVKFIKFISKSNHKIYWEIPTYSKNKEKELSFNNFMHKYISTYLTGNVAIAAEEGLNKKGYIFTTNGVNSKNIRMKRNADHQNFNLVCVATFDYWHGYDRLIEGLNNYYKNNNNYRTVSLHMVGNGNLQPLKDLVEKHNLGKYVTFHGVLVGEKLDDLFDQMDIAVGNLGFHRVGVYADTSIKIREYCARGIPFVTALKDSDFPSEFIYRKKVPADESAIDIVSIIEFYDKLNQSQDYSNVMRLFACNNLSWEMKMKFILE